MSNRNPLASYDKLAQALTFVIRQRLKEDVHTCLPGLIEAYDPETKRCSVQPALDLVKTDGETMPRAVLVDVPVWVHGGGGWLIHPRLRRGDAVLILFSERGLENWKAAQFKRTAPEDGYLADRDALVLPGFGLPSITPANPQDEGLSIQSEDGATRILLRDGEIEIRNATRVKLDAADVVVTGNLEVKGENLTHQGTNVGRTHRHQATKPGLPTEFSGTPQP